LPNYVVYLPSEVTCSLADVSRAYELDGSKSRPKLVKQCLSPLVNCITAHAVLMHGNGKTLRFLCFLDERDEVSKPFSSPILHD
jgi:hypothetical protein